MTALSYSSAELDNFLVRADNIAPIWVKDICELKGCKYGAPMLLRNERNTTNQVAYHSVIIETHVKAWMIGTTPARKFRIVGVINYITIYENDKDTRWIYGGQLASLIHSTSRGSVNVE